jgi:hypothetical protein
VITQDVKWDRSGWHCGEGRCSLAEAQNQEAPVEDIVVVYKREVVKPRDTFRSNLTSTFGARLHDVDQIYYLSAFSSPKPDH